MQGLVTILENESKKEIEVIWNELRNTFDLIPVEPMIPHFSWAVAEKFEVKKLEDTIKEKLNVIEPLTVKTSGISKFTSPYTILYLPIVVTKSLLSLHEQIWNNFIYQNEEHILGLHDYYSPGNWIPHITLVHQKRQKLEDIFFLKLLELIKNYEFSVRNLSLIDVKGNIFFTFTFGN